MFNDIRTPIEEKIQAWCGAQGIPLAAHHLTAWMTSSRLAQRATAVAGRLWIGSPSHSKTRSAAGSVSTRSRGIHAVSSRNTDAAGRERQGRFMNMASIFLDHAFYRPMGILE